MLEAEARARLKVMLDADSDPALDVGELDTLLALAKRPDLAGNLPTNLTGVGGWAAATAYSVGTVVRVTASGEPDRYWRVHTAGRSGATTPSWPDLGGRRATLTRIDDDTVVWEDVGSTWTPTWDLSAAAAEGWTWKAGKAAARFDFDADGQSFRRAQIAAACREQAARYRNGGAGATVTAAPSV